MCQFAKNRSPKIRQCVSSPKIIRQRFANGSVRQGPFAKDSPTCQFAKDHSPKIRQRVSYPKNQSLKIHQGVSSPRTIRQRFANVSVRQGPFAKDSPTCEFAKKPFAKDSRMCLFAKDHSPKIRQCVSWPKSIRQRFANVSVRQNQFAKDSPMRLLSSEKPN